MRRAAGLPRQSPRGVYGFRGSRERAASEASRPAAAADRPVETVKLPAEGSGRSVPELGFGSESTRDWWATIWASPMAAVWLDADVPGLTRLARLVDADSPARHCSEMRQLEDRFGLSPLARRRLQW